MPPASHMPWNNASCMRSRQLVYASARFLCAPPGFSAAVLFAKEQNICQNGRHKPEQRMHLPALK